MAFHRFKALETVLSRTPIEVILPSIKVSEFFGENVFGIDAMKEFLSEEAFKNVMDAMDKGTRIDRKMADQVAASMKSWASS